MGRSQSEHCTKWPLLNLINTSLPLGVAEEPDGSWEGSKLSATLYSYYDFRRYTYYLLLTLTDFSITKTARSTIRVYSEE